MDIILNNRNENIDANAMSISELLKYKNYTFKMMVVKVNGALIKKDQYATSIVSHGDDVQLLHMISGG
jgi:sulfur carrier protein